MNKINKIAYVLVFLFVVLQIEIIVLNSINSDFVSQVIEHETEGEDKSKKKVKLLDELVSTVNSMTFGFDNFARCDISFLNTYLFHFYTLPDIPPEFNFSL